MWHQVYWFLLLFHFVDNLCLTFINFQFFLLVTDFQVRILFLHRRDGRKRRRERVIIAFINFAFSQLNRGKYFDWKFVFLWNKHRDTHEWQLYLVEFLRMFEFISRKKDGNRETEEFYFTCLQWVMCLMQRLYYLYREGVELIV